MKNRKITITNRPAFPAAEPNEVQDGRYREWQDRARVNLEPADPEQRTNLERDYEPEDNEQDNGRDEKFY